MIWDDVFACSVNDAQCVRINSYCICHCLPGYILEDEKCLKSELAFLLKNNTMKYREYTGFLYKKTVLNITMTKDTFFWEMLKYIIHCSSRSLY